MSEPITLTPNERRAIELLREIKANKGHGELRIRITDGTESLLQPMRSELPPSLHGKR